MALTRTTLLDLPVIATGTESGVWGDITNNGLTQYLDIAIAGMTSLTSSDFTAGALTIETTEGTSSATNIVSTSAQYAGFRVSSLATNSTITVGNTGSAVGRAYRIINADSTYTLTFKATGQSGVTFPAGTSGLVAFNGTDYQIIGTYNTIFNVDNLRLDGNTISSTDTNGNVVVAPNGTGDVQLDADTVRIGDSNANATLTTNGTGDLILNTNAGTNSGSITIQDAANGNIVLAPNGTGRVEVSGTSSNAGGINFYEDTDNGTNKALLTAPAALGSDITVTLPDITSTLGYRNIPPVGTKTGSYTLATSDVGEYVQVGSGGSITIPDATFAEGDVISIFNNTSAGITITCSITTAYIAGTDSDKATMTLATRGVATVLFISSTVCVVTGNVS
jgi:hypothetical protein